MKKSNSARIVLMITAGLISIGMLKPELTDAGNLEPSAAPASTMKTLDEVEPRIPIPGSENTTSMFTISKSGSYYLTGDRFCIGTGIQVDADNVTIDLMGYSLIGFGQGTDNGINMNTRNNVEIRNGTIRSFYRGISDNDISSKGHRIIAVRSMANRGSGIFLMSEGNLVKGCTVNDNGKSDVDTTAGIYVGNSGMVIDNTVSGNGANCASRVCGIYAGVASSVADNIVNENGLSAVGRVDGICVATGSIVAGNVVYANGTSCGSDVYGINTMSGSKVTDNTVYANGSHATGNIYGIKAGMGCTVTNNTSYLNGEYVSSSAYGILCNEGCTVTKNTSRSNGLHGTGTVYGIYFDGNSLVDQNTAYNNNGTNMSSCPFCTLGLNHAP